MTNNQKSNKKATKQPIDLPLILFANHLKKNNVSNIEQIFLYYRAIDKMLALFVSIANSTEYILKKVFYTELPQKKGEITNSKDLEDFIFSETIKIAKQECSPTDFIALKKEMGDLKHLFLAIKTLNKIQTKILTLRFQYKPIHLIAKEMNITEAQTFQTIKQTINHLHKQTTQNVSWAIVKGILLK